MDSILDDLMKGRHTLTKPSASRYMCVYVHIYLYVCVLQHF